MNKTPWIAGAALAATMTADEIVAQLRQTGDGHQGAGRKRR